jgi:hypothetical protein
MSGIASPAHFIELWNSRKLPSFGSTRQPKYEIYPKLAHGRLSAIERHVSSESVLASNTFIFKEYPTTPVLRRQSLNLPETNCTLDETPSTVGEIRDRSVPGDLKCRILKWTIHDSDTYPSTDSAGRSCPLAPVQRRLLTVAPG